MPAFWLDMSHMATNHFLSGRRVPSIIVPAVTENWREHLEYLRGQAPVIIAARHRLRRESAPGTAPCSTVPS